MSGASLSREVARAFADLLSYPDDALSGRLRCHAARLPGGNGAALDAVADRLALLGPGGAEELYPATFDLRPGGEPRTRGCTSAARVRDGTCSSRPYLGV